MLRAIHTIWVIVKDESGVLAVGIFTGADKQSSMTLYVKPSRRREGIGTALLKELENNMRNVGVEKIVCDFKDNELEKNFYIEMDTRIGFIQILWFILVIN